MKKLLLLLSFILSVSSYAQIPTAGMVAGYDFSGNANDVSGNNNNGIIYGGATLTTGRTGLPNSAYHFNGIDSYIEVADNASLDLDTAISLLAVFKSETFYTGPCQYNAVANKWSSTSGGLGYTIGFTDNTFDNDCFNVDTLHDLFRGDWGSNNANPDYGVFIRNNVWYCVAYTVSNDTERVYINDTLYSSAFVSSSAGMNNVPVWFGRSNNGVYSFTGIIDDIRIYNRALSLSEIQGYCSVIAGINEVNDFNNSIRIYPNPSSGNFKIKGAPQNSHLEIFNMLGEKIYSEIVRDEKVQLHAAAGIYFVKVSDGEKSYTQKLVIQ